MRMRKKKHSAERIAACGGLLISDPLSLRENIGEIFGNGRPLMLEIGCGKGDFAVGLSSAEPEKNLIALERVPDVAMFALEKAAATAGVRPDNLRFIIGNAAYLEDWFPPHSLERIYVNFCDPWPKKGYHKRRLTAPSFLAAYSRLLVPGGELRFKTDNSDLFEWSVEQFESLGLEITFITRDLHSDPANAGNVETEYEKRFSSMGVAIKSAHVRFDREIVLPEKEKKNAE